MVTTTFSYHKAASVDEALNLLKDHSDAKLMAGGQSLLPAMKLRLSQPSSIVYIGQLDELQYIRESENTIHIGAASTHEAIAESDLIKAKMPFLSTAAGLIGDPAVRSMGTIGGSLAHADPAADWPASLIAAKASMVLRSPGGSREIDVEDFFQAIYMTDLAEDELITEIKVPVNPPGEGALKTSYTKFMQPASRFAIVGCAVVLRMNGDHCTYASVGFTGVGDIAFRDTAVEHALNGQILTPETIEAASKLAANEADILSDHFASEKYRKHLAEVYAKRAITAAINS